MRKPKKEIQLTSYDELLGINEAEQNNTDLINLSDSSEQQSMDLMEEMELCYSYCDK